MKPSYHPSFPQPEDSEAVLWRYMDFDKFLWLVNKKRLFMPAAEHLGDPLEGTPPGGEVQWWATQFKNADSHQKRVLERNRQKLNRFRERFMQNYFVSCWNMNPAEDAKMWRNYTKSPDAVAIRSTYSRLCRVLPDYVFVGIVRYLDYSSDRIPLGAKSTLYDYIMHKNLPYKYESEVRVVACSLSVDNHANRDFDKYLFECQGMPGFKVFAPPIDVAGLIDEVMISNAGGPMFGARIELICAGSGLPKPRLSTVSVHSD